MKKYSALYVILMLLATSCASYRPILDENKKYTQVGEAKAEKDIDVCMNKADSFLAKHKNEKMKKQMGRQAVQGAALGGIVGGLSGGNLQSAVGGAAVGAGVGAVGAYVDEKTKDQLKPDELKQRYVQNCLQRKSYQVVGWK